MPLDLTKTLVIGISATALFDLSEADKKYRESKNKNNSTLDEYRQYMRKKENEPLEDGTGMPLVEALLALNKFKNDNDNDLIEVVVMSRNSPETGVRVFNNIREKKLGISRHAFTGGESVVGYLDAFEVDLFLTTNEGDAQKVADVKMCAVAIVQKPPSDKIKTQIPQEQVRIAFDGDAVLFDETSEIVYKTKGMQEFHQNEDTKQDIPMGEGPYAVFLKKLSALQDRLPFSVEYSPVRIAIVTARNAPAELRVIKTLRHWGVYVDEVFFLGGLDKSKILKAFKPHIFFDDQKQHLDTASHIVPSGKVPYRSDSELYVQATMLDDHEPEN